MTVAQQKRSCKFAQQISYHPGVTRQSRRRLVLTLPRCEAAENCIPYGKQVVAIFQDGLSVRVVRSLLLDFVQPLPIPPHSPQNPFQVEAPHCECCRRYINPQSLVLAIKASVAQSCSSFAVWSPCLRGTLSLRCFTASTTYVHTTFKMAKRLFSPHPGLKPCLC